MSTLDPVITLLSITGACQLAGLLAFVGISLWDKWTSP
jgi:hypothetical protein